MSTRYRVDIRYVFDENGRRPDGIYYRNYYRLAYLDDRFESNAELWLSSRAIRFERTGRRRNDRGGRLVKTRFFPSHPWTRARHRAWEAANRGPVPSAIFVYLFLIPSPNYIYVFICTYKSGFRFWKEQTVLKSPERFLFYLFLPRFDSRRRPLSAVQTFFFVQNYRTYVTQCTFFFLYFVIIIVENGRRDREYCW